MLHESAHGKAIRHFPSRAVDDDVHRHDRTISPGAFAIPCLPYAQSWATL
jgi:hypothetical protein